MCSVIEVCSIGFPHSEISGSQVATHLPEAYRSYATSFIVFLSQGIHHTLLILFLLKKLLTPQSPEEFRGCTILQQVQDVLSSPKGILFVIKFSKIFPFRNSECDPSRDSGYFSQNSLF